MAERSTDAQFLKPAVLSLAFGVLFALLVTLLMVPALYLAGDDCKQLVQRLLQRSLRKDHDKSLAEASADHER